MSDYFTRLGQRALGLAREVRPAVVPLFAAVRTGVADRAAPEDEAAGRRAAANAGMDAGASVPPGPSRPPWSDRVPATEERTPREPRRDGPLESGRDPLRPEANDPGEPLRLESPPLVPGSPTRTGVIDEIDSAPRPQRAPTADRRSTPAPVERSRPTTLRSARGPAVVEPQRGRVRMVAARAAGAVAGADRGEHAGEAELLDRLRALGAAVAPRSARAGEAPNVVKVTIGRIEVRAVHPPALPTAPVRRPTAERALSLGEYLEKRAGGRS